MPSHFVKCYFCGERFDLNSEQGIKVNERRYGHLSCCPKEDIHKYKLVEMDSPVDPNYRKITDFIKELIGDHANWPLLAKQLKNMREKNNFTYSGILGTLQYLYVIKNTKIPNNYNVLGLVPYNYKNAKEYYQSIKKIEEQTEVLKTTKEEIKEIEIPIPIKSKKKKLFKLGEDDE
jgi:hypothetical protein